MARSFEELRARMSPERRALNEEHARALLAALDLAELRQAQGVTPEEMARRLEIAQSNVSRLENRGDVHVSKLREVVAALGGEMEILARFPEGTYRIRQFDGAEEAKAAIGS